jgi:predicted phosphodiesterase
MKIQLLSDLHLEAHPHFGPTPAPGADVLILAGDIGSYQAGSLLGQFSDASDFGLSRFSPLPQYAGWPTPVLFVPGNHEYDGLDFDQAHVRLREVCERLGILWLEREVMVLQGVRFVGTTLWSDFEALIDPAGSIGEALKKRDKAFRAANFYLRKNHSLHDGQPILAEAVREQSLLCQQWLRAALAQPFAGATVVVTHFAPSLQSADPRYGLTPGTAGFCNALDDLLPLATLWLHGHLHAPSDYVHRGAAESACRVVANPLGYLRKQEQGRFKPAACIEI